MQEEFIESNCSCEKCVRMCHRKPCWPIPLEAKNLIDAGFANKLALDWWWSMKDDKDIALLSPAFTPEFTEDPFKIPFGKGTCVFLNIDKCDLHNLGLKPFEGRIASCKEKHETLHKFVARTWDNDDARSLIEEWKKIVKFEE